MYEVPLSMFLLANFLMCGIMLLLRAVLNMLVRNASPGGPMCFKCRMFRLSRPCELLFLLFFKLFLGTELCECNVISL